MILNRLEYDRQRYKILNDYMEERRRAIRRAGDSSKRRLDDAHALARARGDMLLEFVRRDVEAELDAILYSDMMAGNDSHLDKDFPLQASKYSKTRKPFGESPDFLSSFHDLFPW